MDRLRRAAVLTRLIQELRNEGSWCGETHIQKATLFLQELLHVPLGFEFILYKHGPFSFDLRDDLAGLRADGLVDLEPQWPYGPQLKAGNQAAYIQRLFSKTLKSFENGIAFVAKKLGSKGVGDLERVATAFFVTDRFALGSSVDRRAEKVSELKPHIPLESARAAVMEVDGIVQDARKTFIK
jgi:uncharacterized protein YwgA